MSPGDKYRRVQKAKEELLKKVKEHEERSRANQGQHPANIKFTFRVAGPLVALTLFSYAFGYTYFKLASRGGTNESTNEPKAPLVDSEPNISIEDDSNYLLNDSDAKWRAR